VRFDKPVLEGAGPPANHSVSQFQNTAGQAVNTGTTVMLLATPNANPLGIVNTAGSLLLPVGNYLVSGYINVDDNGGAGGSITAWEAELIRSGVTIHELDADFLLAAGNTEFHSTFPPVLVTSDGTHAISLSLTMTTTAPAIAFAALTFQAV
jgi:hypothetical protein